MENEELIKQVTEKAEKWLTPAYDAMKWKADEALFLLPNCSTGNMKYMVPNGIPTAVP